MMTFFSVKKLLQLTVSTISVMIIAGCANTWHSHVDGEDDHHKPHPNQQNYQNNSFNYQAMSLPPFFRHLADGYLELSKDENYRHDFKEIEVFAEKSRRAEAGQHVLPHYVNQRNVPSTTVHELEVARERLMRVMQTSVFRTHPYELAQAQVKFDCWLEEQEENLSQNDIDICKFEFYRLMDLLDPNGKRAIAQPAQVQSAPAIADPCPCEPAPQPRKKFIVYFDLDQAIIREDAAIVLEEVKRYYMQTKPKQIIIQGHTDRSGNLQYNQDLSTRRSNNVMQALRLAGIPKNTIVKGQFGERKPQVATPDGKRLQENRRVEIWFIY